MSCIVIDGTDLQNGKLTRFLDAFGSPLFPHSSDGERACVVTDEFRYMVTGNAMRWRVPTRFYMVAESTLRRLSVLGGKIVGMDARGSLLFTPVEDFVPPVDFGRSTLLPLKKEFDPCGFQSRLEAVNAAVSAIELYALENKAVPHSAHEVAHAIRAQFNEQDLERLSDEGRNAARHHCEVMWIVTRAVRYRLYRTFIYTPERTGMGNGRLYFDVPGHGAGHVALMVEYHVRDFLGRYANCQVGSGERPFRAAVSTSRPQSGWLSVQDAEWNVVVRLCMLLDGRGSTTKGVTVINMAPLCARLLIDCDDGRHCSLPQLLAGWLAMLYLCRGAARAQNMLRAASTFHPDAVRQWFADVRPARLFQALCGGGDPPPPAARDSLVRLALAMVCATTPSTTLTVESEAAREAFEALRRREPLPIVDAAGRYVGEDDGKSTVALRRWLGDTEEGRACMADVPLNPRVVVDPHVMRRGHRVARGDAVEAASRTFGNLSPQATMIPPHMTSDRRNGGAFFSACHVLMDDADEGPSGARLLGSLQALRWSDDMVHDPAPAATRGLLELTDQGEHDGVYAAAALLLHGTCEGAAWVPPHMAVADIPVVWDEPAGVLCPLGRLFLTNALMFSVSELQRRLVACGRGGLVDSVAVLLQDPEAIEAVNG